MLHQLKFVRVLNNSTKNYESYNNLLILFEALHKQTHSFLVMQK